MTKRMVVAAALAAMVGVVIACSDDSSSAPPSGVDAGIDVAVSPEAAVPPTPASGDIQLVSISDWHGQLEPIAENDANKVSQQYGGIAVLKAYFAQEKSRNPNTLFFTAGDAFGASPIISGFFDDQPAVEGLNFLGISADTFGNHNFDNGTAATKKLIDLAAYKLVSTNLKNVAAELGPKVASPYTMLETGTIKVAVLGITNPDAPKLVFPGRMGTLEVQDPIQTANDAAAKARADGANVVVCLVHMGATSKDAAGEPTGPAIDFAQGLTDVDVVLADHTDVSFTKTIGKALVVENRSKGRTYARVSVHVADGKVASKSAEILDPLGLHTAFLTCAAAADGGTCACPDVACPTDYACTTGKCQKNEVTPDPGAAAIIDKYKSQLAAKLDVKIGTTTGLYPRGAYPTATDLPVERVKETAIGDLVADAMLAAYKTSDGAQIAFTNGGGLRDAIPSLGDYTPKATGLVRPAPYAPSAAAPWDVLVGDAQSVLRFGNTAVIRKISGKLLWQVLEFSVAKTPAADGRFLQIAGFKYTFDRTKTPRVQSVTLDQGTKDIPSTDTTDYVMVTNDFTNAGGDGYTMLKETTPTAGRDVLFDVLIDYIKQNPALDPASHPLTRIVDVTP